MKLVKNIEKNLKKHTIGSLLLLMLLVFVGGYLVNSFFGNVLFAPQIEGNANTSSTLTYYHMNGCGHCQNFTPIWDNFVNNNNFPNVNFTKVEASSGNVPASVNGFPTIILTKADGSEVEFNNDRTVDGLNSFLSSNNV